MRYQIRISFLYPVKGYAASHRMGAPVSGIQTAIVRSGYPDTCNLVSTPTKDTNYKN